MKPTTCVPAIVLALALAAAIFGVHQPAARAQADQAAGADAEMGHAEIIAIKFHADWCGKCKAMGTVFEELQTSFDKEPVLYVVFDHTDEFDRRQSAYMAHALGLDEVWKEHGGTTGFVLLIDAESKEVVQRLSHEQDLKQMGAALQDAVKNATGAEEKPEHPEHPKKSEHPEHPEHPKGP